MKKTIYLNAGHSDKETGALSKYGVERDINIAIRDVLIPELKRQGFKVEVIPDNLNLRESIAWEVKKTKSSYQVCGYEF